MSGSTGTAVAKANEAVTPQKRFAAQFQELVKINRQQLQQAAADHVDVRRLYRVTLTCVTMTPALLNCTTDSIYRAMQQCAELGLEPGSALGEAYLVPYKTQAQLIIGYRGLIALARRSGTIQSIQSNVVYEGDHFECELGLHPILRHVPGYGTNDPTKIRFAYAVANLRDGGVQFDVMTKLEIDAIRKRSRAGDSGPWVTDYAEMAKKTVIRRFSKLLPMTVQMARAVELDESNELGPLDDDKPRKSVALTDAGGNTVATRALPAPEAVDAPVDVESTGDDLDDLDEITQEVEDGLPGMNVPASQPATSGNTNAQVA